MKDFIAILIGIILGLLETVLRLKLFGLSLQINLLALVALALILSGYKKRGLTIWLAGAILMDILSPYRLGLYLLSSILALILAQIITTRSFDIKNPLVAFITWLILLFVYNFFQLLFDPIISLFIASSALNAIIGTILLGLTMRFSSDSLEIKVGENVHIR